ncbi:MAG: cation:proton antiporter [Alphaproteobacteria bacterium]|nr:cation:proton antiporter [Alphaproteobacteria bacterium]
MHHAIPGAGDTLTTIVLITAIATVLALLSARFRVPIIIGYIFTGVVLGQLDLVIQREAIVQLAELGVILLLFFAGTEMRLTRNLAETWRVPVVVCLMQLVGSMLIVTLVGVALDWTTPTIVLIGFCFALSSTALTIGMAKKTIANPVLRQNIIGVLIVQDLMIAPMLVVLNEFAAVGSGWLELLVQLGLVLALLGATILAVTRTPIGQMRWNRLWRADTELSMLVLLGAASGGALIATAIGMTPAFGGFLAGLLIGNGKKPLQAARQYNESIQALLMMVFFVSIGLLVVFPSQWWAIPLIVLLVVLVVAIKTVITALGFRLGGSSRSESLQGGLLLGQVGEFSFVLGAVGIQLAITTDQANANLIIITVLTLLCTPFVLPAVRRLVAFESSDMDRGAQNAALPDDGHNVGDDGHNVGDDIELSERGGDASHEADADDAGDNDDSVSDQHGDSGNNDESTRHHTAGKNQPQSWVETAHIAFPRTSQLFGRMRRKSSATPEAVRGSNHDDDPTRSPPAAADDHPS